MKILIQIQVVKSLEWINALFKFPAYYESLKELPTTTLGLISKDELAQFASILAEVIPVINKVTADLAVMKEEVS